MSLIDLLSSEECWRDFYNYKASLACQKPFLKDLKEYILNKKYLSVIETINNGDQFPLPNRSVISKMSSEKKRVVYVYPKAECTVLKLLTHLLLRQYDSIFADNLYSFRPHVTAKDAIKNLLKNSNISKKYSYKVDISNYFNSINIDTFLPILKNTLTDDDRLYTFLSSLLTEKRVYDRGKVIAEDKGIMAGTPQSAFYANLFLNDLDHYFFNNNITYARYSDDIIVFGNTQEQVNTYANRINKHLSDLGLNINTSKEIFSSPSDGFVFLGFKVNGNVVDIAPATIQKLKSKMRRKARALVRWKDRNGIDGESAAKAFIRVFNKKLLDTPEDSELSWSHWFFSVINTSVSLNEIDLYAQDCIRYIISGKRTKSRFNVKYDNIKKLGYKSLVHEYYNYEK